MEPFIKRSWIIDSVVIILIALALPYARTYHIEKYLFQFPLVTFLIFYFIGKAVQRYNDRKKYEDQTDVIREMGKELEALYEATAEDDEEPDSDETAGKKKSK